LTKAANVLSIVLGVVLPVLFLLLVIIAAVVVVVLFLGFRVTRHKEEVWNIDWDELEMVKLLGEGGYGQVYQAKWKETDVAVKVMQIGDVSKEVRRISSKRSA